MPSLFNILTPEFLYHIETMLLGAEKPQNLQVVVRLVLLLGMCLTLFVSCATAGPAKEGAVLKYGGRVGESFQNRYYSHSHVNTYQGEQLVHEKDEIVEFVVETKTNRLEGDEIHQVQTTLKKDGPVDLHDLAFPEEGEILEFILSSNAEVKFAKGYPRDSLFYVPPFSLSKEKVAPGDTWEMQHKWLSLSNGVPLVIHLVTIFKKWVPCGGWRCAHLELSGEVELEGAAKVGIDFSSELSGHLIFSPDFGNVLYSEVNSMEMMRTSEGRLEVDSCIKGQLEKPAEFRFEEKRVYCQPNREQNPSKTSISH